MIKPALPNRGDDTPSLPPQDHARASCHVHAQWSGLRASTGRVWGDDDSEQVEHAQVPRRRKREDAHRGLPGILCHLAMTPTGRQSATSLILWNWLACCRTGSTPPSLEGTDHGRHDLHIRQPQPGPRGQLRIRAAGAVTVLVTIALSLPLLWLLTRPSGGGRRRASTAPAGRGSIHMEPAAGAGFGVARHPGQVCLGVVRAGRSVNLSRGVGR